jgi:REP element-mobilizing transposase RayT
MQHTYICVRVHFIFSTKDRRRLIPPELQPRLWSYLAGIAHRLDAKVLAIGGLDDHAHLLLGMPATITIAALVQKLKANSSRWMKDQTRRDFAWQEGYGAFSVSVSLVDATVTYIRNQAKHHRRRTFDQELREILTRHGLLPGAVPPGL